MHVVVFATFIWRRALGSSLIQTCWSCSGRWLALSTSSTAWPLLGQPVARQDSQEVSGLRSVAEVLGSDRAQPVPGGRRAHRIGRTRMTPWSRRTAHSSRRTASASRCGDLLRARLRAYWGLWLADLVLGASAVARASPKASAIAFRCPY